MNSFGVFYTCFTEYDAVDYSINLLKQNYPECPIFLVSDGGSDYTALEIKYSKLKTVMRHDSRGILQKMTYEKWNQPGMRHKIFDSVMEFFNRNLMAIDYCQTENILIMEPDVLVRGHLTTFPNRTIGLLGSCINKPTHDTFMQMRNRLRQISGAVDIAHFGSTPAFYNVKAMLEVIDFVQKNNNIVREFIDIDPAFSCYDIFLTMLFAACGYAETYNPDIVECIRNPSWGGTHHPLVHQFREKYPSKNAGYTGRHA